MKTLRKRLGFLAIFLGCLTVSEAQPEPRSQDRPLFTLKNSVTAAVTLSPAVGTITFQGGALVISPDGKISCSGTATPDARRILASMEALTTTAHKDLIGLLKVLLTADPKSLSPEVMAEVRRIEAVWRQDLMKDGAESASAAK